MAKGIRRKDLREPDEFLTLSAQALEYAKQHEREVTLAVFGVIALVAVALGVRWYRSWQEAQAETVFGSARRDFSAQKFDQAAQGFERVSSAWPNTLHGRLALTYLGNSYAELGKTKEAEAAFEKALQNGSDPVLVQIARYNLGVLKGAGGDKAGAAKELGAATTLEGPLRGVAWFARLGSQQEFVEDVSTGLAALDDLGPETRAFVEAQIAARATKGAGK